jgi:hypothetical protein
MAIDFLDFVKHAMIEAAAAAQANCRCLIYTGGLPSTRSALPAGTRLVAIPTGDPTHDLPVNRVAQLRVSWVGAGIVSGVAGCFVIVSGADGAEVVRARGTVSDTAGAGDMKLTNVNVVQGVNVQVDSYPLTLP